MATFNAADPLQQKVQELTKKLSDTQQTIAEMKQQMMISTENTKKKINEPDLFVCKFKLRSFNGGNPHRWLNKAELYFRVNETLTDMKKLDVAEICMEGDSEDWFALLKRRNPNLSWSDFKELLVDRYVNGSRKPYPEIFEVKQNNSTVDEYVKKFENVAAMTTLSDYDCMVALIEGFRDEIKNEVIILRYKSKSTIEQVIRLARHLEAKFDKDRW